MFKLVKEVPIQLFKLKCVRFFLKVSCLKFIQGKRIKNTDNWAIMKMIFRIKRQKNMKDFRIWWNFRLTGLWTLKLVVIAVVILYFQRWLKKKDFFLLNI